MTHLAHACLSMIAKRHSAHILKEDFLRALMGGCSTPISALAEINGEEVSFKGNVFSVDGKEKAEIAFSQNIAEASEMGEWAAAKILNGEGKSILEAIHKKRTKSYSI